MTTAEQRKQALALGNTLRLGQAALRKKLQALPPAESRIAAAAIVRAPTEDQGLMKASYLIRSVARFGTVRADRLSRKTGITSTRLDRRLTDLSARERTCIANHLIDPHGEPMVQTFTRDEMAFMRRICDSLSRKTNDEATARQLRNIADKCDVGATV